MRKRIYILPGNKSISIKKRKIIRQMIGLVQEKKIYWVQSQKKIKKSKRNVKKRERNMIIWISY